MNKHLVTIGLATFLSFTARAEVPSHLKCLWSAYRNFKISADHQKIVFPSGKILPYSDGNTDISKIDPLNLTSIEQMFLIPYPVGKKYSIPRRQERLRSSRYGRFFKALYGSSPASVEKDLVFVKWVDGSYVEFNKNHGAAKALSLVVKDLVLLLKDHPEYRKYLKSPLGGTYNWRHISQEQNLSMHSFGIAIDINLNYADYWLWDGGPGAYRNRIPLDIVTTFEKHGFVWGGKWYHFDTMHFEYRPELLYSDGQCQTLFSDYKD
ncbi:MAG TPA: M15 family metallopeptidase [Bdellovibrio sp.]|uniref:M15 family metallopeptidase n=1 Tax=Bdellovibrio sp. TaxID=28201 RepID=UPI002F0310F6